MDSNMKNEQRTKVRSTTISKEKNRNNKIRSLQEGKWMEIKQIVFDRKADKRVCVFNSYNTFRM